MRNIIIGTAGHIDHGKTSLVKALTGIDTDRLQEEQVRGLTIDLGFAFLDLGNGQRAGIVDVPGHERFIKNMLAGATGIDLALFIVAADDSVMPQTREHLDILNLLGIKRGIIALTKKDLADDEWLELVIEDISNLVDGTLLEGADIVPVSSTTGEGVENLKERLTNLVLQTAEEDILAASGRFRLPIDRAFTMPGFGCVITGSLISGKVGVGDEIEILPMMERVRVRGIQVHGEEIEGARTGQRAALNLSGVKTTDIQRGYVLAAPQYLKPTMMVDCSLHHLTSAKRALVNRARVRFHVGTSEVMARAVILDKETCPAGDMALVQFRLESPVVVERGDRYVIRSYSPMRTIGGGEVLRPRAKKLKRFDQIQLAALELVKKGDPKEIVEQAFMEAGFSLTSLDDLCNSVNIPKDEAQEIVASLTSEGRLRVINADHRGSANLASGDIRPDAAGRSITLAHAAVIERVKDEILDTLRQYHKANPLKLGMDELALKSAHRDSLPAALIPTLISELLSENNLKLVNKRYALADFQLELSPVQSEIRKSIESSFLNDRFSPPSIDEALSQLSSGKSLPQNENKLRSIAETLAEDGTLVEVSNGLHFHQRAIHEMRDKIVRHIEDKGSVKVSEVRDLLGTTRKYALPVLEYLDKMEVTKRVGDERVLGAHHE